jgi:hypothetical protein
LDHHLSYSSGFIPSNNRVSGKPGAVQHFLLRI